MNRRSLVPAPARVVDFVQAAWDGLSSGVTPPPGPPCPACGCILSLVDYRRTETAFIMQEAVQCPGCALVWELCRREQA